MISQKNREREVRAIARDTVQTERRAGVVMELVQGKHPLKVKQVGATAYLLCAAAWGAGAQLGGPPVFLRA